jgi:membrane associated rhomboid family serine protease
MIPIRDDQPSYSTPFINYFIIGLNVLVFLFELSIGAEGRRALNAFVFEFGVVPVRIERALAGVGQYTLAMTLPTILTSMFLHGGWLHIIGNMWFLWIFGDNIEDHLGHFRYLLFYLACGVAAAITHIIFNLSSNEPTVGASGAIAGVMGAYVILYPRARVLTLVFFFLWWIPAWVFLGYWFLIQFLSGAAMSVAETSRSTGGIAFWAHVGGFVAGILLIKILPQRARRYRYGSW